MARVAVVYACAECGYSTGRWFLNGGTQGSPVSVLLNMYVCTDGQWALAEQSSASPSHTSPATVRPHG
jgi:hypothetical protein